MRCPRPFLPDRQDRQLQIWAPGPRLPIHLEAVELTRRANEALAANRCPNGCGVVIDGTCPSCSFRYIVTINHFGGNPE